MYVGFLSEHGKMINDYDAFAYALERCMYDDQLSDEFEKEFNDYFVNGTTSNRMIDFEDDLLDWFYSGDWIYVEEMNG